MISFTLLNNKGGTGKTTATIHLAVVFGNKGKRVLVIDNDTQANTSNALMPLDVPIKKCLYDIFLDKEPTEELIPQVIYKTNYKNVSIIPNIEETSALEVNMALDFPNGIYILQESLFKNKYINDNFDIILIDCAPNLGLFTTAALMMCQRVIVPVLATSANSVRGFQKIIELIQEFEQEERSVIDSYNILINGVDRRKSICKVIIKNLKETFDSIVFKSFIPTDSGFETAEMNKQTIFAIKPWSNGAKLFRALGQEILGTIK